MTNPLVQFKHLEGEFEKVVKRYNQSRELSTDENILNSYRKDLQTTYNNIVDFNNDIFTSLDSFQRESIKKKLIKIRDKLIISYEILKINQEVPTNFTIKINIPSRFVNKHNTPNSKCSEHLLCLVHVFTSSIHGFIILIVKQLNRRNISFIITR